jgi:hypothetical protein
VSAALAEAAAKTAASVRDGLRRDGADDEHRRAARRGELPYTPTASFRITCVP